MSLEKLKPIPLLPRESFHRTAHGWRVAMRTRLLLDAAPPPPPDRGSRDFDANMVVILSALLCALLCALSLNSIVRCALRCRGRGGEAAATGLKRRALRQIPAEAYAGAEGAECAICLGDLHRDGERVRVLPVCRHVFHVRCIDTWFAGHSSCPTCRHSLVDKEGKERMEGLRREPPVIGSGFLL